MAFSRGLSWCFMIGMTVALVSCQQQRNTGSTTRGSVKVECDEALWPVMQIEADDFQRTYTDAHITMRSVEAREAIANFFNDSVRVIVTDRMLNKGERDAIAAAKVEFQEFRIALDGIAVITHKDNPVKDLRMGQLDSIFSGRMTKWPVTRKSIDVAIGNVNSSTNEVFGTLVLKGEKFTPEATAFSSSERLVEFVRNSENAIGIVGLSWVRGLDKELTVIGLGDPSSRPDSTEPLGKFYRPFQAYVYKGYYPLVRAAYMYTRELTNLTVGYGFIAHVTSAPGQQIFLNNGLVPTTMPVRIVNLTSQQVKPQ